MDNVTHAAAGLLVAQTLRPSFRRAGAATAGLSLFCVAAANLPDLDSLAGWFGPESYLLHHRGFTHSIFALPLLALLAAWAARRLRAGLTLRQGFLAAAICLATHLFLDAMTAFGTQLFAPLSDMRVAFEGVFIVDPGFTLALLALALLARLAARRSPGMAERAALAGLVLLVAYPLAGNVLRLGMQSRYEAMLAASGQDYDRVSVTPDALAPYYWKVMLEHGDTLSLTTADIRDPARPYPVIRLRRADRAELLRLGEQASIFRTFAWFAEHPAEYPDSRLPGGVTARRFVEAAFVNTGPVMAKLFGQGASFGEFTAMVDDSGRLLSWMDWRGRTYPVATPGPGPTSAHAAHP
jgi:inner membrane protein